jgi:hypothetical protein
MGVLGRKIVGGILLSKRRFLSNLVMVFKLEKLLGYVLSSSQILFTEAQNLVRLLLLLEI